MKLTISADVKFRFPVLSREQMDAMMCMSAHHYDAKCQDASSPGTKYVSPRGYSQELNRGFLDKWSTILRYYEAHRDEEDYDPSNETLEATWGELDTCLKIMEWPRTEQEKQVAHTLTDAFRGALRKARPLLAQWSKDVDTEELSDEG